MNTTTKIESWMCEYGHIWETTFSSISLSKSWCPVCVGVTKKIIDDYCRVAKNKGFLYILDDIPNSVNTQINGWLCKNGHLINSTYTNIRYLKNYWCYECDYSTTQKTLNDYNDFVLSKNYEYILDYIPQNTSISILGWKCNQNHVWKTRYKSIKEGSGCPYCSKYKSEHMARNIIEDIMGLKFPKVRPPFLHGLELDGYCRELKLSFEYQGKQHYEYVPYFHRIKNAFEHQQKRDQKKYEICMKKDICLILIPYKFNNRNKEDMKTYIIDQLILYGFIFFM